MQKMTDLTQRYNELKMTFSGKILIEKLFCDFNLYNEQGNDFIIGELQINTQIALHVNQGITVHIKDCNNIISVKRLIYLQNFSILPLDTVYLHENTIQVYSKYCQFFIAMKIILMQVNENTEIIEGNIYIKTNTDLVKNYIYALMIDIAGKISSNVMNFLHAKIIFVNNYSYNLLENLQVNVNTNILIFKYLSNNTYIDQDLVLKKFPNLCVLIANKVYVLDDRFDFLANVDLYVIVNQYNNFIHECTHILMQEEKLIKNANSCPI
jgi:hypothetical protein